MRAGVAVDVFAETQKRSDTTNPRFFSLTRQTPDFFLEVHETRPQQLQSVYYEKYHHKSSFITFNRDYVQVE
jgi:hypothetical protein